MICKLSIGREQIGIPPFLSGQKKTNLSITFVTIKTYTDKNDKKTTCPRLVLDLLI